MSYLSEVAADARRTVGGRPTVGAADTAPPQEQGPALLGLDQTSDVARPHVTPGSIRSTVPLPLEQPRRIDAAQVPAPTPAWEVPDPEAPGPERPPGTGRHPLAAPATLSMTEPGVPAVPAPEANGRLAAAETAQASEPRDHAAISPSAPAAARTLMPPSVQADGAAKAPPSEGADPGDMSPDPQPGQARTAEPGPVSLQQRPPRGGSGRVMLEAQRIAPAGGPVAEPAELQAATPLSGPDFTTVTTSASPPIGMSVLASVPSWAAETGSARPALAPRDAPPAGEGMPHRHGAADRAEPSAEFESTPGVIVPPPSDAPMSASPKAADAREVADQGNDRAWQSAPASAPIREPGPRQSLSGPARTMAAAAPTSVRIGIIEVIVEGPAGRPSAPAPAPVSDAASRRYLRRL